MFPPQVSVAMGCAARDRNVVFASTLASFFTRAYDQLRTAAISESNINLCGSHCGLSTGQSAASCQNSEPALSQSSPTRSFTTSTLLPLNPVFSGEPSLVLVILSFPFYDVFSLQLPPVTSQLVVSPSLPSPPTSPPWMVSAGDRASLC